MNLHSGQSSKEKQLGLCYDKRPIKRGLRGLLERLSLVQMVY